jgi:hypothetical protein
MEKYDWRRKRVHEKQSVHLLFAEQESAAFRHRSNMVEATSETWRPQLFAATTRLSLFLAAVRRFFDIQAGLRGVT